MNILENIVRYIEFLEGEKSIDITFCRVKEKLYPLISALPQNTYHKSYYCQYLKKDKAVNALCLKHQLLVLRKLKTKSAFEGICHAGIGEYIFGIYASDNSILGFISAGTACLNKDKSFMRLNSVCQKHGLDCNQARSMYSSSVKNYSFSFEYVKTLVNPLRIMVEKFAQMPHKSDNKTREDIIYQKALLYLTDNFVGTVTLDDLCRHLSYSRTYVCKLFLKKAGESFNAKLSRMRLERAKLLLLNTDFTVSEIAYMSGFTDSNYFSTVFKKYCLVSPKNYRKTNAEA